MARGKRSDANQIGQVERRLKVLELRQSGQSYRAIGAKLNVSYELVRTDIDAALSELAIQQAASADQLRALELDRLDALQAGLWAKAIKGDVGAVDRVLKISESRRKLLGLDLQPDEAQSGPMLGADTQQLLVALFEALADHPIARLAVASRLEALAASQQAEQESESTIEGEVVEDVRE